LIWCFTGPVSDSLFVNISIGLLIQAILDRTGYGLDVTTGQRKYGGPPPGWEGGQPGPGHEVSHRLNWFNWSYL